MAEPTKPPESANVPPQVPPQAPKAPLLTPEQKNVHDAALKIIESLSQSPLNPAVSKVEEDITVTYLVPEDFIAELVKIPPESAQYTEFTKGISPLIINLLVGQLLQTPKLILTSNILKLSAHLRGTELPNYTTCKLDDRCTDKDLEYLVNRFPNIEHLNLSFCKNITDDGIKHLQNLPKLKDLQLTECVNIKSLEPLARCPLLTELDLRYCEQITDLSPLSSLTNLTSLDLTECTGITRLNPLSTLTNLTYLSVGKCPEIIDLSPLMPLTKLKTLDIQFCNKIPTVEPLMGLYQLKTIILPGCYSVPPEEIQALKDKFPPDLRILQ